MARRYVNPNRPSDRADARLNMQVWAEEESRARRLGAARQPGGHQPRAVVVNEARTYNPQTDRTGALFLADVARAWAHKDPGSVQRLAQHMAEERVERGVWLERAGAGTSNFAGMVVPAYLTADYGLAAATGRPFADVCTASPLPPEGMTVVVPAATAGTAAGGQTGGVENTAAPSAAPQFTPVTENVQIAAGSVTLSRQVVDRGDTAVDVTLADLLLRQASALDSALINLAVSGLNALATAVTYTDASPTPQKAYSKILAAAAACKAAVKPARPTHAIMTSPRWWWMSEPGTTWSLVNGQGQAQGDRGGPVSGTLPCGLAVVEDDNVPVTLGAGTQDRIYVVSARECLLFEADGPEQGQLFIRAEQPSAASLGVQLTAWSYYAACMRRLAGAVQAVDGTGLIAPVFA